MTEPAAPAALEPEAPPATGPRYPGPQFQGLLLDPPLQTADLPGIGGQIRLCPEDFAVREIPAYGPDERVVAIFTVAYTRPNAVTKDAIRLFTALVNRAAMSIANMELFEQTRDLAVMEERNRLARDLHDSAKQKAFAAVGDEAGDAI